MEYDRWAPLYDRIRTSFGFPWERERAAADRLRALLPPVALDDPVGRLAARLRGRAVVIVGLAPRAGPPPLWRRPFSEEPAALVAADGATATCLDAGLVPDVVVTDLDGPVPAEVTANRRGALVVVHAHGDNVPLLEEWVPQFPGELVGSWAGPPGDGLIDPGGFTDGDRAAYVAESAGAARLLLWGFDFTRADEPDHAQRGRKLAKLAWADRALAELAASTAVPVERWHRDGSRSRYSADGMSGASTR